MVRRHSRALIVFKKSAYQLHVVERKDPHLTALLRKGHPDAVELRQGHRVHQQTLETVKQALTKWRVPFTLVYRGELRTAAGYDLVVCVGGDGTVLQAAHLLSDTPILGVNSDPQRSEAVFCAATGATFERVLRQLLAGKQAGLSLSRLRITLNGRSLEPLALNDVLVAHEDPSTMSRYRLQIGRRREVQKSSGLWIATAAGSSSAVLAAGGTRLAWSARRFQYRPRELYHGRLSRCRLTGGILLSRAAVQVTWLMREGVAYLDGPHVRHPLRFGDRLVVTLSPHHPLRVLGIQERR